MHMDDFGGGDDVEGEGEDELRDVTKGAEGEGVGGSFGFIGAGVESFGEFAGDEELGVFAVGMAKIKKEASDRKGDEDAGEDPGEDVVAWVEIVEEEDVRYINGGDEEESSDDFGAENEEKGESGGFGFGIFAECVMVKKSENAGHQLQRSHNKHGQNDDSDRDENTHA